MLHFGRGQNHPGSKNVIVMNSGITTEPPHERTNKMTVGPAKTQISLGNHPV